jgi:hypothetical protein
MLVYFRSVLLFLTWLMMWLLLKSSITAELSLAPFDKRLLTELSP